MAIELSDDDFESLKKSEKPPAIFKKKSGLPWKTAILPVFLWIFCAAELLFLFLQNDAPKIQLPAPVLNFQGSDASLPAPFCPTSTKIIEKECPAPQTASAATADLLQESLWEEPAPTKTLRIQRAAPRAENPQLLAKVFFQKGVQFSLQKEWESAAESFARAHRFSPDSPDIAFNLALALEHLSQKSQAVLYYEKALQSAQKPPAHFDKAALTRHLNDLKK